MLALTDAGFAASLTQKLAVRAPERYGPAAQQLREKADRVLQRQREQRQHEKNLREGKKAPWLRPRPSGTSRPNRTAGPLRRASSPRAKAAAAPLPIPPPPAAERAPAPPPAPAVPIIPAPAAAGCPASSGIIPKK